jgi:hypothetical protein
LLHTSATEFNQNTSLLKEVINYCFIIPENDSGYNTKYTYTNK